MDDGISQWERAHVNAYETEAPAARGSAALPGRPTPSRAPWRAFLLLCVLVLSAFRGSMTHSSERPQRCPY